MLRSKAAVFFLLSIPQGLWASAQIYQAMMTTSLPSQDCSITPTGSSVLAPTVSVGYFWFVGLNLNAGDVISTAFFSPSGQWYSSAGIQFQTIPSAGSYCFTDGSFLIAGHTPASTPGMWTAYVYDNGVSVGSLNFTISASTCTYSLATSSASVSASAGTGSFGITAGTGCPWTATSNSTWLTTSSSGSGSGTVNYSVTANTATTSRSGTIAVGSQTFTVTQAAAGASNSITIANPGFETLPSSPAWIDCSNIGGSGCRDTVDANIPGWTASGAGPIGLLQPGPNLFPVPLPTAEGQTFAQINSGTISQTLGINLQVSTAYTLQVDMGRRLDNLYPSTAPTAQLFAGTTLIASATGTAPPLGGWTTWTGTYQSSASDPLAGQALKIVLGTTAAQGDFDNVRLTAAPAGTSPTCSYTLGATSASPAAAGGAATVSVTTTTGCTWTASTSTTWITITSGASGSGNGTVGYSVAANTGAARTGTITIAGQTFTVNQAATATTGTLFSYNGFASTSGLTLVGNAATTSTTDGTVLRLTPATGSQSGAAYSTTPVTLGNNASFSTQFQFRFSSPGGQDPADGITFVLGTSTIGLGGSGVGMGYQGVSGKSVAIEFDTFNNTGYGLGNDDGNSSNHVSIDTNGNLTNTDVTNVYGNGSCGFTNGNPPQNSNTVAGCMSNGHLWTVNISYNGSNLTVTLSDPAEGTSFTAINGYPINLASALGQNTAYVGFTAGTGGGWENHDIVSWTFANTSQLPTTGALSVSLGPSTGTNTVGANDTVTATVTDSNGLPQANVAVTFTISAGPNAGKTGTCNPAACTTNANGQVTFTYTGSGGAGTDSIQACIAQTGSTTGKLCCAGALVAEKIMDRTRQMNPQAGTSNGMVVTPNNNATALATALLGSGVTLSGTPTFTGAKGQAGTFTNAPALVGFSTGIILSSGEVSDAAQMWAGQNLPNTNEGQPGNTLLSGLIGGQATNDASVLTFSFIPTSSTIYFAYTFASAEYPNYIGKFNDVFGFFVNGTNYALIPSTNTAVSINNVNATTNSAYFNKYNSTGDALPYGGETKVLAVTVPVNPGQVNTITLAVADALDYALDSAVFIQTGSFSTTPPPAAQTCSNTVTQTWTAASSCSYTLGATSQSAAAAQGSYSVSVTAATGCTWTASTSTSWITITSGSSGTGNGTVTFTVAANTGTSRTGTVTIAGQTFTVSQAAPGGGTTPGCNYFVSPLSQNQPASVTSGNITGLILVNTNTGCSWTAVSNNSWITIVGGATGNGTGAVSYQVSPNTATAARTGTMTIAAQTVTVVQAAGTACAYTISPSVNSAQALGGSSSILLTANPNSCPWTVVVSSSASSWLHVTSATSGTGPLSINYKVDANTTTQSRTGTITVAGQTFTLTQAGGASATAPNISQGGIVNAANNRGGAIAQGSFFSIYGSNLGPPTPSQATTYPIPTNMGNVTVTVTQGSTTQQAYLDFVSATQINAILPSNAPLGTVQITVNYNGTPSTSVSANVVATAFGIFSTAGGKGPGIVQNYNTATDQPLNMASIPAKPQQIGIIWGTGLGPITTGDNQPPPGGNLAVPVQVTVAGQQAQILYSGRAPNFAGVDNVYFTVPTGVSMGCYVPVQVNAGGTWSNTVTISLSADGSHCQDTSNVLSGVSSTGGNLGLLGLMRLNYYGQLDPSQAASNSVIDLGIGDFAQVSAGGDLAQSPFMNLPPVGSCKSTNRSLDLGSIMGTGGSSLDPTLSKMLDAGTSLTITGPKGSGTITQVSSSSPYMGVLGGSISAGSSISVSSAQNTPFLDTGPFTITGTGGADVGPFTVSVNLSPAVTWTNEMQISAIDRSKPLTLTWTGGDSSATMLVVGASSDPNTQASGGFTCLAPMSAGTFTVPVNSLSDLVAVNPSATVSSGSSSQLGVLGLMPLPMTSPQKFTATGLAMAYAFDTTMILESVQVK